MRAKWVLFFVGAAISLSPGIARADHPTISFSAGIAGPAITIPATTLAKGTGAVTFRIEYIKFKAFSDAELLQFAQQGMEAHGVDYILTPSMSAGYGFTDDFTIGLRLPYLLRTDIREGHVEGDIGVDARGDSGGVGDLTLLGQYRFLSDHAKNFESAILAGIKIPTGATGVKDRSGSIFEVEHQPGSGSWDPLVGVAVSKQDGALSLDANTLYAFATRGAQRTNLGHRLNYNFAVSYRLGSEENHHHSHEGSDHQHFAWDLILELNGEWQEKQKIANVVDENSGGSLIYLSPGARLCGDNGWAATMSIGVPIFEDRNGVQHETDLRLVFGLSKGF